MRASQQRSASEADDRNGLSAEYCDTVIHHRRLGLAALSLSQIAAWGILSYAVLVAAPAIALDTGWDERAIFAAITAGLLASAVCAVPVGRLLDRSPRVVMLCGAAVGALALVCAALSPTIWLFAASWIVCGAAQAAVLYQASFTIVTHRYGTRKRGPLTIVTLAGGLASTVFAPIAAALIAELGWRSTFGILAGVLAVVLIPVFGFAVERRWSHHGANDTEFDAGAVRSLRFWIVTAALALMSFSLYAVTLAAVPAAVEKGLDLQSAAWVLGLIGAGQVFGRLVYLAVPHRSAPWVGAAGVGLFGAGSLVAYALAEGQVWIIVAGLTAGAARGALTLVQASAVSDRWGARSYGRLNGVMAAPITALTALAPAAAAVTATALGSYATMALTMAGVCAIGGMMAIRR